MHPRSGPEGEPMRTSRISRRRFLATTAAASTLVAMPHVRGSHAAGKLSLGLWDHWVPGANKAMDEICQAGAAKGNDARRRDDCPPQAPEDSLSPTTDDRDAR